MIIVDTREPKEELLKILAIIGAEYELKKLDYGDYDLGFGVIVERKTISDFYASIMDGRFETQFKGLVENARRPIVAIVGDIQQLASLPSFNPNVIYGGLASLFVRHGMDIIWVQNDWQLLNLIWRIHLKVCEVKEGIADRRKIDTYIDPVAATVAFLSRIKGVSPVIAARMIAKFGSIKNVVNATIGELMEIEGLGMTKAEDLYRFFNMDVRNILKNDVNKNKKSKSENIVGDVWNSLMK